MNKITAILIAMFSVFLIPKGFAQKKMTYGVGVDIFQTKLNNVDRENFSGYGHSVPGFTQNDQLGFGATFLAQTPIYKNLSFETGLGITNFNSQFHFNYIDTFVGVIIPIDRKLNISLYYLNLPLKIAYNFPISPSSSIQASIGINSKFLFAHNDNYEKIIVEFIGGQSGIHRYNQFILTPQFNIGFSKKLRKQTIRLDLITGFDTGKFTNENKSWWFGFYKNLSTASYLNYGLSLKYFFTK